MGATQSTEHSHTLETKRGKLKGIEVRDNSGKPIYHRYLKVPYALPPVDKLRWRRPQPLSSDFSFSDSSGSPGDYTKFGPICPQPLYNLEAALIDNPSAAPPIENVQSEDCLYLNIWVPAGPAPSEGWPVQFHIHGGWLQIGDANQSQDHDPFDLFAHSTPRIIVAPTYRLNLFGFLAGADLASVGEDPAPANYGLWDQRCALEWTGRYINLFSGNPDNITVGGLSAGANSTFFQLYFDAYLPEHQRLIKRIYLWSNAVAIQPSSSTSDALTEQFNSLCSAHDIDPSLPATQKLNELRQIPAESLVSSLKRLKQHTFRSSTDNDFIPATFLSSVHSGDFTTRLAKNNTGIMLGEVRDEYKLYKLINPPSTRDGLLVQVGNYYPKPVVDALIPLYKLPSNDDPSNADAWADVFARMVADAQVHASTRGFTHILLNPPKQSGVQPLSPKNVHRYRISFRAKGIDEWLEPSVEVCHAADTPIWWGSGWRAGFDENDKQKSLDFLKPFDDFLYGKEVKWGKEESREDRMRLMDADGTTKEDVEDDSWDRGLEVWNAIWNAQKGLIEKVDGLDLKN